MDKSLPSRRFDDMFGHFIAHLNNTSPVSVVVISVSIMLFCGFLATRFTKMLRLPNVTAYILTGVILGPCCCNAIPHGIIVGTEFISDIALAFIAFSVGEFFRLDTLRKNGSAIVVITILEALAASAVVFIVTYFLLRLSLPFSIVLAALAYATAPASTIMTIRQTHAKGELVETLLQVVALDDVVALLAFSISLSIALASLNGGQADLRQTIALPLLRNAAVLLLGALAGGLLHLLMRHKYSTDNRLIIALATLFAFCGVCALAGVSPLLGCMSMGMAYINLAQDDNIFKQLNYFSPPILLLFFVRSGISFRLDTLWHTSGSLGSTPLVVVGVLYFFARIFGKYSGAYLGSLLTHRPQEVRNYLGLALIPQAGVAIGLADLCLRLIGGETGTHLQTIILSSSILYELVGPGCAKLALYLSGSYTTKLEELTTVEETTPDGTQKTPTQLLIERIQQIRATMPELPPANVRTEEEEAFNQAAESYSRIPGMRHGRFLNH